MKADFVNKFPIQKRLFAYYKSSRAGAKGDFTRKRGGISYKYFKIAIPVLVILAAVLAFGGTRFLGGFLESHFGLGGQDIVEKAQQNLNPRSESVVESMGVVVTEEVQPPPQESRQFSGSGEEVFGVVRRVSDGRGVVATSEGSFPIRVTPRGYPLYHDAMEVSLDHPGVRILSSIIGPLLEHSPELSTMTFSEFVGR